MSERVKRESGTVNPARTRLRGLQRITPGAVFTALAAVIIAAVATRDAAVLVTANQYPALAVKLAPANATAITRVFDSTVLTPDGLRQDPGKWLVAAKQALRADPLNASGIRLLAYVIELMPGDTSRARKLMLLSERASRRDMLAQMWLVEDAVRRGDVVGALRHYDRALSVRPVLAAQLLPILAIASSEPTVRAGLVPYLRANRPWVPSFLSVVIAKSPDPAAVVDLFRRYGGARVIPAHAKFETALVKRLVMAGMMSEAQSFATVAGAGPALNTFGFTRSTVDPHFNPLTWALYEGPDGDVGQDKSGALTIAVRPEARIVAATRIISQPRSAVVLKQQVSYPDKAAAPLITWKAYCRRQTGAPQQFWARDVPPGANATIVSFPLDTPTGCAGVQIDVEATGTGGSGDLRATIGRVELTTR